MSEITREQVAEALAAVMATGDESEPITKALGYGWLDRIPKVVNQAWFCCTPCFLDALERWLSTFPPVDHKAELERMARPRPAEDPAPTHEVVDVPQPIVKRSGDGEVRWLPGADIVDVHSTDRLRPAAVSIPVALMEAMVDAIRATRVGTQTSRQATAERHVGIPLTL